MKKVIPTLAALIIGLFILAVFGWMSVNVAKGHKDFGVLNEPIKFMYSFLDQFEESVKEVKKLSPTFMPIWSEVNPINKLEKDLKILVSYSESSNRRTVAIKNLKTDAITFKWEIKEKANEWDRIVNPYMFQNKDLIYFYTDKTGLRKIDSSGNMIWSQDSILAHHSLNPDSSGNLWVCTKKPPRGEATGKYHIDRKDVYYDDDYITSVDANSGKILFNQSVTSILKSNGLASYLLQASTITDPIHLNDVEPALKTTKHYNEGDVFLSIKQSCIILHYRPETNKVLKVIEGPFSGQHDVDFFDDTSLTIFNNNAYTDWKVDSKKKPKNQPVNAGEFNSNIARYSFIHQNIEIIESNVFDDNGIFTTTEGLHEYINDSTYFVEEQNVGHYWVIQNGQVLYKNVFNSQHEGHCHLPNWARIIKE
jgi:hypothetical protein